MPRISGRLREVAAYKNKTCVVGGRLWEKVAYERWWHMEGRLYCCFLFVESMWLILVLQSEMVALTN